MSVDTMEITANDAALALDIITNRDSDLIEYVDQAQMSKDMATVTAKARVDVLAVVRLSGVATLGDRDLGEQGAAATIVRDVDDYRRDPAAFVDARADAAGEEEDAGEQAPDAAEVVAVQPQPTTAAVPAPVPSPVAALLTEAEAKVSLVERSATTVFPKIPAKHSGMTVPTIKWETAKPDTIAKCDKDYHFEAKHLRVMSSAIRRRKNVILTGDPGCGKTEFLKQFAASIGLPCYKIPFDGNLTRAAIIGGWRQLQGPTGSYTAFQEGLVPQLIRKPCLIILDEIDQADPDVQYLLHPVYEGEGITLSEDGGRFVKRHDSCYIAATANTKGRGSDNGLTNARFEMSEATRDRFPYWLDFTYLEPAQEAATIVAKTGIAPDVANMLVECAGMIRNAYRTGTLAQPCSLRQLLEAAQLAEDYLDLGAYQALARGIDVVIRGRANPEDAAAIAEFARQTTNVDLSTLED